jgi:hypothetical protein
LAIDTPGTGCSAALYDTDPQDTILGAAVVADIGKRPCRAADGFRSMRRSPMPPA